MAWTRRGAAQRSDRDGEDGVPSDKPNQTTTNHAVLGPGVALYDDHSRTRMRLILWIAMIPLGLFGIWIGRSDLGSAASLLGVAEILGGAVLIAYSAMTALVDARRLTSPICLVIARDGFAMLPGDRTVAWDEVETISDPRSTPGDPGTLRVQLSRPNEFERRHGLSPFARLALKYNRGDLVLGGGTLMPVVEAEALMRTKLAESRKPGFARAGVSVPAREREARPRKARR
jgi:hypothetical protein